MLHVSLLQGVIVMAATNLPETLDPALKRPGRFDRHVAVPLPDVKGRAEVLGHYLKDKPVAPGLDTVRVCLFLVGFCHRQTLCVLQVCIMYSTTSRTSPSHLAWTRYVRVPIFFCWLWCHRQTLCVPQVLQCTAHLQDKPVAPGLDTVCLCAWTGCVEI
jgi:hypothetical protein